jgi:hypothetical protein
VCPFFFAISVLLRLEAILQDGPLQWGRINLAIIDAFRRRVRAAADAAEGEQGGGGAGGEEEGGADG